MVANIMLALHCKKTEAIDLKSPIWEYISNTYSVDQVCCEAHVEANCVKHIPSAAHPTLDIVQSLCSCGSLLPVLVQLVMREVARQQDHMSTMTPSMLGDLRTAGAGCAGGFGGDTGAARPNRGAGGLTAVAARHDAKVSLLSLPAFAAAPMYSLFACCKAAMDVSWDAQSAALYGHHIVLLL